MARHKTGTREEWLAARLELLEAEKELTRRSDELARRRQELPWVRVDKEYQFETDEGSASLADLFRGRSQLLVYHFMFGPDYTSLLRRLGAALRRQRGGDDRLVRVHVGDGRDADVRRLDDVDGVDADARTDDRSSAIPSRPSQLRATSATGRDSGRQGRRCPLSRGLGGFTLSSRHGGQVAWKAVPG